jgi:hypothetical protein
VRCPTCKERVIDFAVWGRGINAFRKVECPSCGAKLRSSRRTIVLSLFLLLACIPLAIGLVMAGEMVGVPEPIAPLIFGSIVIPLAIAAAYWVWTAGFYSLRDCSNEEPTKVIAGGRVGVWVELIRYLVPAGAAAGLIALMIAIGYRDLVLTFDGSTVVGQITRTRKPPPGAFRDSDYELSYEFKDASGQTHPGEDVLPSAKSLPGDGKVMIVYCSRDPSISRIASQLSGTPVFGVVFGVGSLVWLTVRMARMRRGPGRQL